MVKKDLIVPPELYDLNTPIFTVEDIRRYNRQRYEMEQLTAIVYESLEDHACVGYKDISSDEFWIRGHIPGNPLLPGVLICEAAAQMASYFTMKYQMMEGEMMGFAGLEDVKFRGIVRPGDRLVIQAQLLKWRKFLVSARFMALVDENIVSEGIIKGFPISADLLDSAEKKQGE